MFSVVAASASAASCVVPRWPDDRGVDEQVEGLGRQRPERGDGQGQDLAVAARGTHAAPLYDPRMVPPPVAAPRRG